MLEGSSPIDLGAAELTPYRAGVEEMLNAYAYGGERRSLAGLMRAIDPSSAFVMGDAERASYMALVESLTVFRAVVALLADKVGLKQRLVAAPTTSLGGDPELARLRRFCHGFATYAASTLMRRRLDALLDAAADGDRPDLSPIELRSDQPEVRVIRRLLAPVFAELIDHEAEVRREPYEFVRYLRHVFGRYAELAYAERATDVELEQHLRGYQLRVTDSDLVLEGYEDRSATRATRATSAVFQPLRAEELVGNRQAIIKVQRYIDRLALFDASAGRNPCLDLGGLAWSVLFDGLPGTGKSSLFRLAMTRLSERATQVGLAVNLVTVDPSIKDEYYGKTAKLLLARLQSTAEPNTLSLVVLDDIDLLTSRRVDAQGADNDINNVIMQYLDGVFTVRRGNVINFAASNDPAGVDDALRNRFDDRLEIDGPQTAADFADMVVLHGGGLLARGLLEIEHGYEPFATQAQRTPALARASGGARAATLLEFGRYMAELKAKRPSMTGRSMRAIVAAVEERAAQFDVPETWFESREAFLDEPYDKRVAMLAELYRPVTAEALFEEADRYLASEERFGRTDAESLAERDLKVRRSSLAAERRLLEEQLEQGSESDATAIRALRDKLDRTEK